MKIHRILLIFVAVCVACSSVVAGTSPPDKQLFKDCSFAIESTENVVTGAGPGQRTGDNGFCTITLNPTKRSKFDTLGDMAITLIISEPSEGEGFFSDYGFKNKGGHWSYTGNPVTIGDVKFKGLKTDVLGVDTDSLVLVGQQTEYGFNQKGAPLKFYAAEILRKTPLYNIEINVAADISVSKSTFERIKSDLVKIAQSVSPNSK